MVEAMTPAANEERLIAVTDQMSTTLEGEVVILNLATGTYFGLNDVGTVIWETLDQPRTMPELRDAMLREFDVSSEVAETDLTRLIEELIAAGLVRRVGPSDQGS